MLLTVPSKGLHIWCSQVPLIGHYLYRLAEDGWMTKKREATEEAKRCAAASTAAADGGGWGDRLVWFCCIESLKTHALGHFLGR